MDDISARPVLDRVLAGRAFAVDEMACAAAATVLRRIGPIEPMPSAPSRALNREILFRISIAAVCHQINWDFLSSRMRTAFDEIGIDPAFLASLTSRHVEHWLSGYHRPERIKAKERAAFLRNVGMVILQKYSGDAELLLKNSNGTLYGKGGLIHRLDDFSAFSSDPLRKKSHVFVHEIIRDNYARFLDEGEVEPAIDYHIMRLYLRSGRVVPLHNVTLELLKHQVTPRPRLVSLIRGSVKEALSLTALYAGMSIPTVNGIEWEIGRDICDRTNPHCDGPIIPTVTRTGSGDCSCPNAGFCLAYADPEWRRLTEPELRKTFY